MKRSKFHNTSVLEEANPAPQTNNIQKKNVRYNLRNRIIFEDGDSEAVDANVSNELCVSKYEKREHGKSSSAGGRPLTGIHKLPNEILFMIFSYLTLQDISTSVPLVCKHWYNLTKSPTVWRRLSFVGDELSTNHAKYFLAKSPLLRDINISYRSDVEELVSQVCRTNRRVQSIKIKKCGKAFLFCSLVSLVLNAKYLNRLIKCCPRIKKLTLKEVNVRSNKFYQDLGVALPKLTHLHLHHGHLLTPAHVVNIATKCFNLTRLWLSGEICCGLSEDWEKAYHTLFQLRGKTLTHLQFDASKIKDTALKDLSLCKNLKMLHLHKAVHLHCEGLAATGSLGNLIALRLHRTNHLSATLPTLFQNGNMKNLIYLSVAASCSVTDDCARSIASHCPQLHVLSLALVDDITDSGVEAILRSCTYLHYLDLFCMKNVTGSVFDFITKFPNHLNFIIVEEICDSEKERFVKSFIENNANIDVYRTKVWKTGGIHKCSLLN